MRPRPLGLALLSVVIAACGGGAPASTTPSPSTSASTELVADVDVAGRTMHLVCVGPTDTGEPTILLEAGGGGDYLSWGEILPVMRSTHRLCAYDRAGLGQSEPPAEASRTTADQVADLRALLDAADVSGPFVIGAQSNGTPRPGTWLRIDFASTSMHSIPLNPGVSKRRRTPSNNASACIGEGR